MTSKLHDHADARQVCATDAWWSNARVQRADDEAEMQASLSIPVPLQRDVRHPFSRLAMDSLLLRRTLSGCQELEFFF